MAHLKLGAGLFIIAFIWWFLADQKEQRELLIQVNTDKISAQAAAQEYANANALMKDTILKQDQMARLAKKAIEDLQAEFTKVSHETIKQKQIFDKHNLTLLAKKKGGLIERRANRATAIIFAKFESAIM